MTDAMPAEISRSCNEIEPIEDQIVSAVLHVCTSCRAKDTSRELMENRLGFKLYQQLKNDVLTSPLNQVVEVKPTSCLSLCPCPCAIALSSSGRWSYLFGEQGLNTNTEEILKCLDLYV